VLCFRAKEACPDGRRWCSVVVLKGNVGRLTVRAPAGREAAPIALTHPTGSVGAYAVYASPARRRTVLGRVRRAAGWCLIAIAKVAVPLELADGLLLVGG
jgi:hypothetical protein